MFSTGSIKKAKIFGALSLIVACSAVTAQSTGDFPTINAGTGKSSPNFRYSVICAEGQAWILFYKLTPNASDGMILFTPQALPNSQYCKK